jgi:hypothetical protein
MEEKLLKEYVDEGLSTYGIAERTKKGQTTVRYWLNKHNLKTKPTGREKLSKSEISKRSVARVDKRRKKFKIDAIKYKGGSCIQCGYNKCTTALEFHHTNPSIKDFTVSNSYTKSWIDVLKELDKCILVCSNCHREIHELGYNPSA